MTSDLTAQQQREHAAAQFVADSPQRAAKQAQVVYRCKKRGCLLAVVIRHHGHRYFAYRQHTIPEVLTMGQDGLPRPHGKDPMRCVELPADTSTWWPDWSMNCDHSAYHLTRRQLAEDIESNRGRQRPIIVIDGNGVGAYDRPEGAGQTDEGKVR